MAEEEEVDIFVTFLFRIFFSLIVTKGTTGMFQLQGIPKITETAAAEA